MTRSSKASKQRLGQSGAPTHVKRKRMRARLVSDDPDLINIRTVTVRTGDEVEIVRGDFGHPNSVKSDSRGKRLGQPRGRAGIIAKVARDRLITKMSKKFTNYAWDKNAGYGTKLHLLAIKKFGITKHHRKTFGPIHNMLSPN